MTGHKIDCTNKEYAEALKEHPQIPVIIDILSRKNHHHVLLNTSFSEKIQRALLESIALYLREELTPNTLREIDFIYFDARYATLDDLAAVNKRAIIAINYLNFEDAFGKHIQSILPKDEWRIIAFNTPDNYSDFTPITIATPTSMQLLALLKTHKNELENYHHVLIPEESFASALSLAEHYLTSESNFDKALDLLDSAAARASAVEHHNQTAHFNPIVTHTTLAHVVSSWTQIPVSHLHNNIFQASKFTEAMQRRVFGQDSAIYLMSEILQHACIKLQEKTGPVCSFLLAGPHQAGKTTTAFALAEHLFGHRSALLRVNLQDSCESIADIKIVSEGNLNTSLLNAIQQKPYAVVLIENIQQVSAATLHFFKTIFTQGYAFDEQGNKYDFRHAIMVITTTLGTERITSLTQLPSIHETNKTLDLMQLVLNEHPQDPGQINPHVSAQELCEELTPVLEAYFSAGLLEHLTVIPFIPLTYSALEKIIRLKVKSLAKQIEMNFGIELNYAPEVVKFLAHEALWRKPSTKTLNKVLEQHLYSAVADEILAYAEDKNRPKRLLLQLNDDGQLLRCEFMNTMGNMIYNL